MSPAPGGGGLCHRCLGTSFAGLRWLFHAGEGAGDLSEGSVLGDGESSHCFFHKVSTKGFILPSLMMIETKSSSSGLCQGRSRGRALLCLSLCQGWAVEC